MRTKSLHIVIMATSLALCHAFLQRGRALFAETTKASLVPGPGFAAATTPYTTTSTRVVYQATDGSLHLLDGVGPPVNDTSYTSRRILDPALAKLDTPLAMTTFAGGHVRRSRTRIAAFVFLWLLKNINPAMTKLHLRTVTDESENRCKSSTSAPRPVPVETFSSAFTVSRLARRMTTPGGRIQQMLASPIPATSFML